MQSLKEDKQFQHSTFLEYTIVLLIAFEVLVEMHALGWINWPPWMKRISSSFSSTTPPVAPEGAPTNGTNHAADRTDEPASPPARIARHHTHSVR